MQYPKCICGQRMNYFKSKKPHSIGRPFYTCPNVTMDNGKRVGGCSLFIWEDQLQQCPCGNGPCKVYDNNGVLRYMCSRMGHENCGYDSFREVPKFPQRMCPESFSGSGKGSERKEENILKCEVRLLEAKVEALKAQSPGSPANQTFEVVLGRLDEALDALKLNFSD